MGGTNLQIHRLEAIDNGHCCGIIDRNHVGPDSDEWAVFFVQGDVLLGHSFLPCCSDLPEVAYTRDERARNVREPGEIADVKEVQDGKDDGPNVEARQQWDDDILGTDPMGRAGHVEVRLEKRHKLNWGHSCLGGCVFHDR